MKKIKYLILPFLAFLGVVSVKAYDFNGINKASRIDFGLYYDTTVLGGNVSCTSSNDGYCGLEDSDLPNASNTYNNLLIAVRDNMNTSFSTNQQYKISLYFYQYTPGYFVRPGDLTNVSGVTYRNFTNWTSDSFTIINYSLTLLETSGQKGLYRFDAIVIPTYADGVGFSFRLYSDYETISNNNDCYIEMTRYVSITELTPGQIDYTQNFNNVINNQNQNTQDIINNQNQNSQDIQDTINNNFQSCRLSYNLFNKNGSIIRGARLDNVGALNYSGANYFTSQFIEVKPNTVYSINTVPDVYHRIAFYFYDNVSDFISKVDNINTFTTPNNTGYLRFSALLTELDTAMLVEGSALPLKYEAYGEQICTNKLDETTNAIDGLNDSINDTNVSDSTSVASNFFSGFTTETYGLTGVITAPLNVIQSITSKTCTPLVLPLPFVNQNLTLPCMGEIYSQYFGSFLTIYQTITFGVVAYWVVVRIFNLVKDFKNPDHDEIEVLDL